MCKEKENIIFCSCLTTNTESNTNDFLDGYSWSLTKYKGQKNSLLLGKIVIPKNDLGNNITVENILSLLNSKVNSFDFDYTPNEKDCLDISIPDPIERIRYFKVKYINEKWVKGGNHPFRSINETIAEGKIKKTNTLLNL
ncbi:hypothetical protein [Tenacibaculum sp. 190524A05c]|uniref:hypothetical protein n=1 Tax=Tenacibaculum platacis TaxID=3137852 RepID=UPI0032B2F9CC